MLIGLLVPSVFTDAHLQTIRLVKYKNACPNNFLMQLHAKMLGHAQKYKAQKNQQSTDRLAVNCIFPKDERCMGIERMCENLHSKTRPTTAREMHRYGKLQISLSSIVFSIRQSWSRFDRSYADVQRFERA